MPLTPTLPPTGGREHGACSMLTNEVRNRSEAELGAAKSRAAGGHGAWGMGRYEQTNNITKEQTNFEVKMTLDL